MQNKLNAVELVIADIEALAKNRGLYLYRYQTNHGNYRSTITYALHNSSERPHRSDYCDGGCVVLNSREGSTKRCEAWRKLNELRETLINS